MDSTNSMEFVGNINNVNQNIFNSVETIKLWIL